MGQLVADQQITAEEGADWPDQAPGPSGHTDAPDTVGSEIRIYREGLLIARCRVRRIAPGRLFALLDPLHFPVNSQLEIEYASANRRAADRSWLSATVVQRSISGVELSITGPIRTERAIP